MEIEEEAELINNAQAGDKYAVDKILRNYRNLVTSVARKYIIVGVDQDDLGQSGMIGLYSAIINFDPSRGATFKTYAYKLIKNEILSEIKHSKTGNIELLKDVEFCDSFDGFSENVSPESDFVEEESYNELLENLLENLSELEKNVLKYYLDGYSNSDIASQMGKNYKKVDNALMRAKKKIKTKLEKIKEGK